MTGRFWLGCVCAGAVLLCGARSATAQVRDGAATMAPRGSASITGVVMSADEAARPLRRALLTLTGANLGEGLLALTDDTGRFEFRDLPDGRFTLAARKGGYVSDVYGARPAGAGAGVPIAVKAAGTAVVAMRLVRSAAFSGRIVMPPGAPVSAVRLQVLKWSSVNSRRQLVSARGGAFSVSGTGEYRIGGLPPGEYVLAAYTFGGKPVGRIQADNGAGAIVGMAPVFSPGTTDASRAQAITLLAGDDRAGVDLVMDFVEMGRVSGRVTGPDGQPVPFVQVSTAVSAPVNPFVPPVRTAADGTFVLSALAPGSFTLVARGAMPGTEQTRAPFSQGPALPLWAFEPVTVNPGAALEGLELRLRPGRSVRGRLVTDGGARDGQPPNLSGVMLLLVAEDPGSNVVGLAPTEPGVDGAFEFSGVAPGQYRLQVTLPEPLKATWMLSSMSAGGRDAMDAPVVVSPDGDVALRVGLTDEPSVLTGVVFDPAERPAPEHSVVVFPVDPTSRRRPSRRVVHVRTGADGAYEIRGLPDGDYYVAVVPDLASDDVLTMEFLEGLATSARVTAVRNRGITAQNLTIIRR